MPWGKGEAVKGFLTNATVLEKFFQRVCELKEDTLAARLAIMSDLIHEENIRILKEDQILDVIKGNNVIVVEANKEDKHV